MSKLSVSLLNYAPELAKQWHPTKNGSLTPDQVSYASNKKVWWLLPYTDPDTGKHFDFEWQANINNRSKNKDICPFLSGKKVMFGFNDLLTRSPELAKEWHPTKNGDLTPDKVHYKSDKIVWWLLPYDDPNTGKHYDFEWKSKIYERSRGAGCPYLVNQKVMIGYNDLLSHYPALAEEWNYEKNGELKPTDVVYGSNKKVWWKCKNGHEWQTKISWRTSTGAMCPICRKQIKKPQPSIAISRPELLAYWDYEKNTVNPEDITINFNEKVHGICSEGHRYQSTVRNLKNGCLICKMREKMKNSGKVSLAEYAPDIAKEWNYEKNGDLTPADITYAAKRIVWWKLDYYDAHLDKNFEFEWADTVYKRTVLHSKCPYLTNLKVISGYNDLQTHYPKLAKEWHPTKNGDLTPDQIYYKSGKVVWWLYKYDDPITGKHFDFEWTATVASRVNGKGCPYLVGKAIYIGFNDLKSQYPELAAEWDYDKNDKNPEEYTKQSNKYVWWKCKDGHSWYSTINTRTGKKNSCPYCAGKLAIPGKNDFATLYPELLHLWDYEKNKIDPHEILAHSKKKMFWKCSNGHSYYASISDVTKKGRGCPICVQKEK